MIEAVGAAVLWGWTDVLAGVSSRRCSPVLAALWLHASSLLVLVPLLCLGPGLHDMSGADRSTLTQRINSGPF